MRDNSAKFTAQLTIRLGTVVACLPLWSWLLVLYTDVCILVPQLYGWVIHLD